MEGVISRKIRAVIWTDEDSGRLAALWRQGFDGEYIAGKLGTTKKAVYAKRRRMGLSARKMVSNYILNKSRADGRSLRTPDDPRVIPQDTILDWDRRMSVYPPANSLGDPLPGYSALDRREKHC